MRSRARRHSEHLWETRVVKNAQYYVRLQCAGCLRTWCWLASSRAPRSSGPRATPRLTTTRAALLRHSRAASRAAAAILMSVAPFDTALFNGKISTKTVGRRIDEYSETPSTMTLADERMKSEGAAAAHGSIILAETQTGGIGRRGRPWLSPPLGNLYFSLLWAPAVQIGGIGSTAADVGGVPAFLPQLSQLNLAASVAVVKAAYAVGVGETARIKWPNDVWAGAPLPRKMSGTILNFDGKEGAVLGVGINVLQDMGENATAVSLETLRQGLPSEGFAAAAARHARGGARRLLRRARAADGDADRVSARRVREALPAARQDDPRAPQDARGGRPKGL